MMKQSDFKKYKAWLSSADYYQRGIALAVLWHTGIRDNEIDRAVALVLRTDDQVSNRRDAVRMIAEMKDEKFKDALIDALDDEDWSVRGEAFRGLRLLFPRGVKRIPRIAKFIKEEVHPFCRFCIDNKI